MRRQVPHFLVNRTLLLHWLGKAPERAHTRVWVVEEADGLAGFAWVSFKWWVEETGVGSIFDVVRPESRGRGHGTALCEAAEDHLGAHGAWKLVAHVTDDAGRRFAERRGYRESRRERYSQLDVAAADLSELPALEAERGAEGFHVVPLRELLDRPHDLHATYAEAALDMPGDETSRAPDPDEWRRDILGNPLLDADASMTVVHGTRPVAFAWLLVDREGARGEHELTGTLRAYRGRGLARLAKLAAVRWCREHGIRTLLTSNDSENAPMLAINDRLGYRPTVVYYEFARIVGERPGRDG